MLLVTLFAGNGPNASIHVSLVLHDLGVLEHRDPAIAGHLAFDRDRFAGVVGQFVIHRFVIADV